MLGRRLCILLCQAMLALRSVVTAALHRVQAGGGHGSVGKAATFASKSRCTHAHTVTPAFAASTCLKSPNHEPLSMLVPGDPARFGQGSYVPPPLGLTHTPLLLLLVLLLLAPTPCLPAPSQSRATAIDQLHKALRDVPSKGSLLPSLPAFVGFLLSLVEDPNFKISVSGLQILAELSGKVGRDIEPHTRYEREGGSSRVSFGGIKPGKG